MDFNKIFTALKNSGVASGLPGGLAGGVIGGALMTKKGRKLAGGALKVGGLAAVGGLAYAAYKNYQKQNHQAQAHAAANGAAYASGSGQGGVPSAANTHPAALAQSGQWAGLTAQDFDIDESAADSPALVLIQAMIAAAGSDGHIDANERDRIFSEVEKHSLSTEEKATLFNALSSPANIDEITNLVSSPALAAEVYAVSAATIGTESVPSKHYLEVLAARLGIPGDMKRNIELTLHEMA